MTAALFGNYFSKEHPHYLAIQSACLQLQFEKIDLFGISADSSLGNPEDVIPQYDVVFAVGRSALEALACGCAVILVDHHGLGGIVTLDNFGHLRECNFAFAATYGKRVSTATVSASWKNRPDGSKPYQREREPRQTFHRRLRRGNASTRCYRSASADRRTVSRWRLQHIES
jgi:hypothetical protein